MGANDCSPSSGRFMDASGEVVNIVDLLGGGSPVSDKTYDIDKYAVRSGRVVGEDGKIYNIVTLLQNLITGSTGGGNCDCDGSQGSSPGIIDGGTFDTQPGADVIDGGVF